MFSRKKEEKKRRPNARGGLSQFGLLDIPNINDTGSDDVLEDGDDDDLEAELLALTSGNAPVRPKRGKAPPAPQVNLDAMVAASLRDIPSDEELSGDDDDPDLLNELSNLNEDDTPSPIVPEPPSRPAPAQPQTGNSLVALLEERQKMYQEAEKNAKSAGESSRARRFGRGIKTLNDLLKQARAGRVVNEEDIPPPVAVTVTKKSTETPEAPQAPSRDSPDNEPVSVPTRPAPPPPMVPTRVPLGVPLPGLTGKDREMSPTMPASEAQVDTVIVDNNMLNILTCRRDQYKSSALQAKRNGDVETALKYVKIAKQFEPVIAAVKSGQPVDLNGMPPPPPGCQTLTPEAMQIGGQVVRNETQGSSSIEGSGIAVPESSEEEPIVDDPTLYNAPPAPTTVLEALQQRLAKYQSTEQAAKDEGNTSKARRMGRIVKQYQDAIKQHKAGKPVPVDELPTPPGFAPIPQEGGGAAAAAAALPVTPTPSPRPAVKPVTPATPALTPASPASVTPRQPTSPATPTSSRDADAVQSPGEKANVRKSPQSRQEKQLAFLLARQKEFKEAALQAKKKGEVNQAKEYLRLAKGFDPLIEASHCGLPVDMATVPIPPDTKVALESDFDFVTIDDCIPGSDAEIFDKLEEDLIKQAKMCLTTRDHFKAIGDVGSANRFEQLALHSKKDLDAVRCAHKRSEPIPKFHYETKTFSIVQCCTDLGDNDLEITIAQGINYTVPNPKDVDTYVKFEFPYPTEEPVRDRTALIKDTNNPEYNQTFLMAIHRNVRACQRVFKRQSIKVEVWSRGGFLRSDTLIGIASVKLLPLETKCILHDSFDLMEGRKPVGGKVEVKVRIRNPILTKQVEQVQEKWLIIDRLH